MQGSGSDNIDTIPLSEMVQSLRRELNESSKRAKDQPLQFLVEKVELELNVEISRDVKGDGKVMFGVFSGSATASKTSGATHTFRLTLVPAPTDRADLRISGESFVRPE